MNDDDFSEIFLAFRGVLNSLTYSIQLLEASNETLIEILKRADSDFEPEYNHLYYEKTRTLKAPSP